MIHTLTGFFNRHSQSPFPGFPSPSTRTHVWISRPCAVLTGGAGYRSAAFGPRAQAHQSVSLECHSSKLIEGMNVRFGKCIFVYFRFFTHCRDGILTEKNHAVSADCLHKI